MAPQTHFFSDRKPLADSVALFVSGLAVRIGSGMDCSGVEVWVPTTGAARRIRFALARLADASGGGLLSPVFHQPMQAMLPEVPHIPVADRTEREGIWGRILAAAPSSRLDALFPPEMRPSGAAKLLSAGGMFCDLCDTLAEANRDPLDPALSRLCSIDTERWNQSAALYREYLDEIRHCGLEDPNVLRFQRAREGVHDGPIQHLVTACVADLPHLAEVYAYSLAVKRAVSLHVLVWNPDGLPGGFDAWGRPKPEEWAECALPIGSSSILVAADPEAEAEAAMDFAARAEPAGDFAIVAADPDGLLPLSAAVLRRQRQPFSPGGDRLANTEPGRVAAAWMEWCHSGRISALRQMLECSSAAEWLGCRAGLSTESLMMVCDYLQGTVIAENETAARSLLAQPVTQREAVERTPAIQLFHALEEIRNWEPDRLLHDVFEIDEKAAAVIALWYSVTGSPVFTRWQQGAGPAFTRALANTASFEASGPEDVELSGWLEAPWLEVKSLSVCGCIEGRLPASVREHPFLPDRVRRGLTLADNASRLARDAWLLSCLSLSRADGDLQCSFPRKSRDGSPSLPSGLLMRSKDDELASRVDLVFGGPVVTVVRPRRELRWRWALPASLRNFETRKISPTDFGQYLSCPFRYFFSRVHHIESFEAGAHEMDARMFGSLAHKAIERFSREHGGLSDEDRIAREVLEVLDGEVVLAFGKHPAPAVLVQIEALKVRLRAFARVQAAQAASGWRICDVERKLAHDDPNPLLIGGLPLSAKVDRLEEGPNGVIRIIDYKTSTRAETPKKAHWGRPLGDSEFIPEAVVWVDGKEFRWSNLQLPLYRRIAERWYPGREVCVAYFLLPADPSCSEVVEFPLADEQMHSALGCAEAVACRVRSGVFWPPQPHNPFRDDPFAPLFMNGPADKCIDSATIEFLKGQAR